MIRPLLLLTLALAAFVPAYAEPDDGLTGPGVAVDLLAEQDGVTPGQPFTVGLHLHHFPGFHSYWQNPGMVGVATSIDWELPPGFKASGIQWPAPQHSHMGEYPCYGYERDVTLLVTITPPEEIDEKQVTLKAETMWMACSKGCFPGYETFTLTLPVTDSPAPNAAAMTLIAQARKELPISKNEVRLRPLGKPSDATVRVRLEHPGLASAKEIHFFSTDRQISSDHPQKFEKQDDGSMILTVPRSEFGPESPTSLPGVLQMDDQFFAVSGDYPKE